MKLIVSSLAVAAGCVLITPAAAQTAKGKNSSQAQQQAKQELDAAQKKLADANRELAKAESEVQKADAANQTALGKVQKARQTAAANLGNKLGLPTALAQRDAAQRNLDTAHKALSKEIRTQPDYLGAAKEAEKASAQLSEVRDDTKLAEDKRKEQMAELSKIIRRPVEIERERIEADANIKQLRQAAAEAGRQAAAIQAEVQKSVEDDSGVKAAITATKDDADKAKKAREDLDKHKKEIIAAQKQVATETQQYQKAVATATANTKAKKGKN
ncbi:MAG: hypothetical protein ACKODH_02835 [Limisphaerales bacterium]